MSDETLSPATIPRLSPAVRFRVLDNEGVVIHQRAGEVLVVNEVGARILQLTDGERTVEAILKILGQEWNEPRERLQRDAHTYLRELSEAGIIETLE